MPETDPDGGDQEAGAMGLGGVWRKVANLSAVAVVCVLVFFMYRDIVDVMRENHRNSREDLQSERSRRAEEVRETSLRIQLLEMTVRELRDAVRALRPKSWWAAGPAGEPDVPTAPEPRTKP